MSSFKINLIKGSSWKLLSYATAFLLNAIIAHFFGADESGRFYYLLNNLIFISLFLSLGIDSGISYFNSRKEIETNSLFSISMIWSVVSALLFALVYSAGLLNHILPEYPQSWVYFTVFICATLIVNSLSSFCYSMNDNVTPNLAVVFINIFLIVLNPVFIKTFSITAYINLYLLLSSMTVCGFLFFLQKRNIFFGSVLLHKDIYSAFLKFSVTAYIASILFILLLRFDYWIVYTFCNATDIGNYIQTSKFLQLIIFIPNLASFVLFPLTVTSIHENRDVEAKLIKLSGIYFYIGLLICTVISIAGYWIFPMLYGSTFTKMYQLFLILTPGIICLSASYAISPFFGGKNLIGITITCTAISIITMLIIDLILVPKMSIFGAAIGCSIGYILYYLLLLYHFRKHHSFSIKDILSTTYINSSVKEFITKKSVHI